VGLAKLAFLPIQFIKLDQSALNLSARALKALKQLEHGGNFEILSFDPVYTSREARDAVKKCFAENVDLVIYFSSCWIESSVVIAAIQEVKIPYVVWGVSDYTTQSLLGATEVATSLRNLGERFKTIYGDPEDPKVIDDILVRGRAARLHERLRRSKIGLIGGIAFSMYDAVHDLVVLREKLGVDVVHVDQYRIMKEVEMVRNADVEREVSEIRDKVGHVLVSDETLRKSTQLYLGLKELIKKFGFDAAVIKCHPELSQTFGSCGCLAASLLIDDGFPCACEGNLYTAVTMYVLGELTGNPPFCHEVSSISDADRTMMLWHCGAGATRLAEDSSVITLQQQYGGSVDPSDKEGSTGGVTLDFWIKPGEATVAQLGGVGDEFGMHVTHGRILKPKQMDLGAGKIWARALMEVDSPEAFLKQALGHQFVTVHGNVEKELKELCELAKIHFK
jgi:L-fucose isomerase-like protein